jgi:hypothetical protein
MTHELLEVLTNESKGKIYQDKSNDVPKEDYTTPKATNIIDRTTG